jgi:predicted phosphoribosyltransferase
MIQNDQELATTRERILHFQRILAQLRVTARPAEFQAVTSGYLNELERMQDEVLEYLRHHSSEPATTAGTR